MPRLEVLTWKTHRPPDAACPSPTSAKTSAMFQEAGPRLRRGAGAPAGARDGRGRGHPARPDRRLLRARPHGRRDPGRARRRGRRPSSCPSWPSRSWPASTPRWRCSWTCRTRWSTTRSCAGATPSSTRATSRSWPRTGSAPTRSREAGSGSDAFALACRATDRRRPLRAHRPQALDHERGRSRAVHRAGHRRSREGLQGDHRLPGRARLPRVHRRQEGGQARHPRLLHLRADPRRSARSRARTSSARWARATRSPSRP